MPGFDGTGPRGFCILGWGRGRGMNRGFGRGMGWGMGGCGRGAWANSPATQDEKGALEARLAALENEAAGIRKLLSEKKSK